MTVHSDINNYLVYNQKNKTVVMHKIIIMQHVLDKSIFPVSGCIINNHKNLKIYLLQLIINILYCYANQRSF